MRLKVKYLIWLATTTELNDVKNKIPNVRILVIKVNYDAKILDIEKKYFAASGYKKFTSGILNKNWNKE